MKKKFIIIMLLIGIFSSYLFAEEKTKQLYLKGETDGIEIKISLLSSMIIGYDKYDTIDKFQEHLSSIYSSTPDDYNMLVVAASNNFPVEIINNSSKSVQFNEFYDTLTFIVEGRQMEYDIKVIGNEYPKKLFPNGKVLFTIKSLYTEQDLMRDMVQLKLGNTNCIYNDNFAKAFLLNYYPMILDYGFKKGKDLTSDKIEASLKEVSKLFYAVYELGVEKKEIYLSLAYE